MIERVYIQVLTILIDVIGIHYTSLKYYLGVRNLVNFDAIAYE